MSKPHAHPVQPFRLRLLQIAVASCFATAVHANPVGPSVVSGAATFNAVGKNLTVTNSPGAIINWQGFSIRPDEVTRFVQSGAASAVLNRVTGPEHSAILGQLLSNGRVFLINPNGVTVGAGARIDTAGFVASSLNLSNEDFLAGKFRFTDSGSAGKVTNAGTITAHSGGPVYLVAPTVENHGVITAPGGDVILAAGKTVELVSAASPDIRVQIQAGGEALNVGQLLAESGRVGIFGAAIRNAGVVSADSAQVTAAGTIVLRASQDVTLEATSALTANGAQGGAITVQAEGGTLLADGRIEAKGTQAAGGEVRLLGEQVGLVNQASVDASGRAGGGTVLVGGDYQGANPDVQNAARTYVGADASIKANASEAGDGGKVVVWADNVTRYYGAISARGGAYAGDGGSVEVSGKQALDFNGKIDVAAPHGAGGRVLLDPQDILLNTSTQIAPPNNGPGVPDVAFGDPPAAGTLTIQIADVTGYSELYLQATRDITIANNLTMAAGNQVRFEAGRDIAVNANVTVSGAGTIALTADADFSGSGGPASDNIGAITGAGTLTTANQAITLSGASIGTAGTPRNINPGTGTVSATAKTGGIFLNQTAGTLNTGSYTLSAAGAGQTIRLSTTNGNVNVNGTGGFNANTANDNFALVANGANRDVTFAGGTTLTAASASLQATRDILSGTGVADINTAAVNGGVSLNAGRTIGAAANPLSLDNGAGAIAASATTGDAFLNKAAGSLSTSQVAALSVAGANRAVRLSTTDGAITVDSTAGFNANTADEALTLVTAGANRNIDFTGATTLTARTATLTATGAITSGTAAADVNTSLANGAIALTGAAGVGAAGNALAVLGGTGTVSTTTTAAAPNGNVFLTAPGQLNLGAVATAAASAQAVNVSTTAGGNLNVVAASNTNDAWTLNSAGTLNFVGAGAVTAASVTATAAGAITSGTAATDINTSAGNGAITLAGMSIGAAANALEFNNGTGTLGATASVGGIFLDRSAGALNTNTLALNAAGAGQTVQLSTTNAAITANGTAGFNANTADDDFVLNARGANRNIDFTGATTLTAASATLTATGAITSGTAATDVNTSPANGNISLSAANAVGAAANSLAVLAGAGTVSATTTAAAGNVFITAPGPLSLGAITTAAGSAQTVDVRTTGAGNPLNLVASSTTNDNWTANAAGAFGLGAGVSLQAAALNATAGGNLTQGAGAAFDVTGATTLAAGANSIAFGNAGNNFGGAVTVASASNVNLFDANALSIGPVNATGNVTVQTAAGAGNDLTLTGNIVSTGGNVTLASGEDVNYGARTITAGGRWLTYSVNPANDTGTIQNPGNPKPNIYNCNFGGPCGATVPATGNHHVYSYQPTLTYIANPAARPYGDPNPPFSGVVAGLVNGDTAADAYSGALAFSSLATATSNVGGYAITGSGLTSDIGYAFAQAPGNATALTITPATLTYAANPAARQYGDLNPPLSGTVTGFKNGETIATATTGGLAFTTPATVTSNVGNHAIDGSGLVANNGNYVFVQAPGNAIALTISPRPITLTAGAAGRAYGDPNPVPAPLYTVGGNGMANGENAQTLFGFTVASGAGAATPIGVYTVGPNAYNVAGVGVGVNGNYNVTAINPGTLTIGQRALQVTADAGQSKIYGEANPAAYTYALTSGSLVPGDSLAGATTRLAGESVGSYPIQQGTLTAGPNYAITFVSNGFAITLRPITITVTPGQAKVYGGSDPVFAYGVVGGPGTTGPAIVAGDSLVGALGRAPGENVGPYAINQGTLAPNVPANYAVTFVSNNFTITPAALTIAADNKARPYGDPNPPLTATFTGLTNGDTPAAITGVTLTTAATIASNAGPYAINVGANPNSNYTITYANGVLTITSAPLTIAADDKTKGAGQPNPPFTATLTGFKLGQTVADLPGTLSFTTPATTGSPAGSYPITPGGVSSTNYAITFVNGQLVVTAVPIPPSTFGGAATADNALITATQRSESSPTEELRPDAPLVRSTDCLVIDTPAGRRVLNRCF